MFFFLFYYKTIRKQYIYEAHTIYNISYLIYSKYKNRNNILNTIHLVMLFMKEILFM